MKRFCLLSIVLLSAVCFKVFAQVSVYPMAVFLDSKNNRSAAMSLYNPTEKEKEVEITFKFGYMKFDSLGKQFLCMEDSVFEKKYSSAPFMSVYPKKIILKSNSQQVVKFIAKNFSDLPDGMYWTRIVSTASDLKKQIDSTNTGKISVNLDLKFSLVNVAFFAKGKVFTEVDIKNFKASSDSASINLYLNISKGGNAPFLGLANVKIKDAKGDEVTAFEEAFPIYSDAYKAISMDKKLFKPGNYVAEIELTNDHKDVPKEFQVPFKPFTKKFEFKVD